MNRTRTRSSRDLRGSTLLAVVALVGTMMVLSLIFLRVGQQASGEQRSTVNGMRTALLAEAGISEAMEALRSGQSGNIGSLAAPAYLGGGVVWVEATDLGDGLIQLDSMAMKDGGRMAVRAVVRVESGGDDDNPFADPNDGFFTMLFSNKHLQLDKDILIDSYDSSLGTYASQATNTKDGIAYAGSSAGASGNSTVQLESDVHVFGDVHTGPGYTIGMDTGAYVSGSTAPAATTIPLAPVTVPVIAATGAYSVAANQTKTLNAGNYHYTSMTLGTSSKLVIKGPSTVVVDGFTTSKQANVEFDCTNGPVLIYDTGDWMVHKEFTIGPKPGTPLEAAVLISSAVTLSFKKESVLQVGFYAPKARIDIDKDAEVWGSIVADEINLDKTSKLHFDTNLSKLPLPWDVPENYLASEIEVATVSWSKITFPVPEYLADRRSPFTLLGLQRDSLRAPADAWEDGE